MVACGASWRVELGFWLVLDLWGRHVLRAVFPVYVYVLMCETSHNDSDRATVVGLHLHSLEIRLYLIRQVHRHLLTLVDRRKDHLRECHAFAYGSAYTSATRYIYEKPNGISFLRDALLRELDAFAHARRLLDGHVGTSSSV